MTKELSRRKLNELMAEYYRDSPIRELVGHMEQLANIEFVTMSDGTERGNRKYVISTGGGLSLAVNADRGLDVTDCTFAGIPIHWRTPQANVYPAYHQEYSRSFPGGLFMTAGYTQIGRGGEDEGEILPQHGHATYLPAWKIRPSAFWESGAYKLQLVGEVRQSQMFGENFVMTRTIETELGADWFTISDVIRNDGYRRSPHMILYHFNLGFPLIAPGTRILFDAESSIPRDEAAAKGMDKLMFMEELHDEYPEQVFLHQLRPDNLGLGHVGVVNDALGLSVSIQYDTNTLPYLCQWKMCEKGTYVLGIEPVNCAGIEGRSSARKGSLLKFLEPGEEVRYFLRVQISSHLGSAF